MQAIITDKQQIALLRKQATNHLKRYELAELLNLSNVTIKHLLDQPTPFVVNSKTFTAVNNYLLEDL